MMAEILSDEEDIVEPSIGFSFSIYNTKNEAGYLLNAIFCMNRFDYLYGFYLNVFSMLENFFFSAYTQRVCVRNDACLLASDFPSENQKLANKATTKRLT